MANTKNPYAVKSVNQKQGTGLAGNPGIHGKRATLQAARQERAPLAKYIEDAYAARQNSNIEKGEREFTKQGAISPDTKAKKFSR
jgi:hypothetical protein